MRHRSCADERCRSLARSDGDRAAHRQRQHARSRPSPITSAPSKAEEYLTRSVGSGEIAPPTRPRLMRREPKSPTRRSVNSRSLHVRNGSKGAGVTSARLLWPPKGHPIVDGSHRVEVMMLMRATAGDGDAVALPVRLLRRFPK